MSETAATTSALLANKAALSPDKIFISDQSGRVWTYGEGLELVRSLARALLARGIRHGDRVVIWAPNSAEWIFACLAIQMVGAAMVPVNTRFKGGEAAYVLRQTRARMMFTVGSFLGADYLAMLRTAEGAAADGRPVAGLAALEAVVLLDSAEDREQDDVVGLTPFLAEGAAVAEDALEEAIARMTPDTIADILFTSGTTGAPKGAMHSNAQAIWMASRWNEYNCLRADDRMVLVNPFFHSFGYRAGWLSALHAGISIYPLATFDALELMRVIERERITILMAAPTVFIDLLAHPQRVAIDLSSLRIGHTGSTGMAADLAERIKIELGYELFMTSYGLTEATALVTCCRPEDSIERIATTVGRAVEDVELMLADTDGKPASDGQPGELLVRGVNVMKGYFENPGATAETIDPDGWLHTGDVATIDADGYVRIVDRLKDIVIVGGFNAYPTEIENALRAHPAIAEVAIVSVPDARLGEVCAACVVLAPGATLTTTDLTAWSRERLANYKVPRHLLVLDALPRTALGKPQKFLMREMLVEATTAA